MNPPKKVALHQQSEEQQQVQQIASGEREFGSVEELLRHDAMQTPVPAAIAQRLEKSVGQIPATPARSWWRRLLGLFCL